jgi:hypothetical protein
MPNMERILQIFFWVLAIALVCADGLQATTPISSSPAQKATTASEKVPVMDGGAGPCSLELTVLDGDGKAIYAATVKVHIAYGFGGIRRLDLEAGTNSNGKVRFTGLPARVHRPPLEFHASKDQLEGVATYDPSAECQARHDVTLTKPVQDHSSSPGF